jgi:uncharacterized protein (TIGR02246 family)
MNWHRLIIGSLVLVGAGALSGLYALLPARAVAPPPTEQPTPEKPAVDVPSTKGPTAESPEAGIKTITEEYVKAFNAADAKAAAALWTPEGEYIGVEGEVSRGRAAIEKSLADEFKAHPKSVLAVRVESVRPLGRQTALAEGVVTLKTPGEAELSETRYSALHVLEDGKWRAASVREWVPDPERGAALKHLDWLVGQWTAKGDAGTIAMSYAWDENKVFLNGKYSITKDGKTVSSGTHVFAVDPAGGLRSWTFDSTGTFCTAQWTRDDKRWIEEVTGVLPSGAEINSVNVQIPLGADAFSWRSTERSADGVPLTPLPPLKVTRVKPGK